MKTVQKVKEITKEEIISGNDTKPSQAKNLYIIKINNFYNKNGNLVAAIINMERVNCANPD